MLRYYYKYIIYNITYMLRKYFQIPYRYITDGEGGGLRNWGG